MKALRPIWSGIVFGLLACSGEGASQQASARADASAAQESCRVTRLVDGDTFECEHIGRVRMIGMDAPEMNQRPFGRQSLGELERLMPVGTTVRLQRDVSRNDRYGRRLAYVWLDQQLINETLVARGYALSAKYPPDTLMHQRLVVAEAEARAGQRGLWREGGFVCVPADWRRRLC